MLRPRFRRLADSAVAILARPGGLVESVVERAISPQNHDPALGRPGLHPVLSAHGRRTDVKRCHRRWSITVGLGVGRVLDLAQDQGAVPFQGGDVVQRLSVVRLDADPLVAVRMLQPVDEDFQGDYILAVISQAARPGARDRALLLACLCHRPCSPSPGDRIRNRPARAAFCTWCHYSIVPAKQAQIMGADRSAGAGGPVADRARIQAEGKPLLVIGWTEAITARRGWGGHGTENNRRYVGGGRPARR